MSDTAGGGSDLSAAVLGGFIGSTVTLIGTWLIAPRVDRRSRAQEAWEQHVLEAGRLVTEDIPRLRTASRSAAKSWVWSVTFRPEDLGDNEAAANDWLAVKRTEAYEAARQAYDTWADAVHVRLRWLVDRLARHSDDRHLFTVWALHNVMVLKLSPVTWTSSPPSPTEAEMDEDWRIEGERMKALRDAIEDLARTEPFPLRWDQRLRQRWSRHRSKKRRTASRQS